MAKFTASILMVRDGIDYEISSDDAVDFLRTLANEMADGTKVINNLTVEE